MGIEDGKLYDMIESLMEYEEGLKLGFALEDEKHRTIQGTSIYPVLYNKVQNLIVLTCEVGEVLSNVNTNNASYISLFVKEDDNEIYESLKVGFKVDEFIPTKGAVMCIEITSSEYDKYIYMN